MREYYKNNPEALEKKRARERERYQETKKERLAYQKEYYSKNKDKVISREKRRRKELTPAALKKAIDYLGGKCKFCSMDHPAALQFYHRDPSTKEYDIAGAHLLKRWEKLVVELDKCDLLCANCHCIEHYSHRDYR